MGDIERRAMEERFVEPFIALGVTATQENLTVLYAAPRASRGPHAGVE